MVISRIGFTVRAPYDLTHFEASADRSAEYAWAMVVARAFGYMVEQNMASNPMTFFQAADAAYAELMRMPTFSRFLQDETVDPLIWELLNGFWAYAAELRSWLSTK